MPPFLGVNKFIELFIDYNYHSLLSSPNDNADEVPFSGILLSLYKNATVTFNVVIYFSFYFFPVIESLCHTIKWYTLDIVIGMCDNCAFSSEVKEVDVSRMLLWHFVLSFSPYISYYSNWFPFSYSLISQIIPIFFVPFC